MCNGTTGKLLLLHFVYKNISRIVNYIYMLKVLGFSPLNLFSQIDSLKTLP